MININHDVCIDEGFCFCPEKEPMVTKNKNIAPATKLEKGQGLKVKGFVSGFNAKEGNGECVVTIHAGKTLSDRNIFSISLPYKLGQTFIGKNVDILIVPTDSRYSDADVT